MGHGHCSGRSPAITEQHIMRWRFREVEVQVRIMERWIKRTHDGLDGQSGFFRLFSWSLSLLSLDIDPSPSPSHGLDSIQTG